MASIHEQTVRIAIPSDLAALAVASETLKRFGADNGVPDKALVQLQVALDEIVSNVIKYAWPEGGSHELTISLTAQSGIVEIEIVDDGREFDPLSVPSPARPPKGRRPRPGGVGIHMTRKLIDGIEYVRTNGQNHIILTKRYAGGVPREGALDGQ
jgi:anti-sigma regulatory factor (Ser/Thr protein kinase)